MSDAKTPAELVEMIYDDLSAWCAANKGVCSLTQNPYDLVEMMAAGRPSGWRLTIHWEGDEPASDRVRAGTVAKNHLRLILDGDLGPTVTPKIALIKATAARSSAFLALVDAVRQRAMAYKFSWLAEPNNRLWYKACDDNVPLPDGSALAAYNLRFDFYSVFEIPGTDISLPIEEEEETP